MGLFGVPGGAVASRLGARRTILASDLARVPLVAAIPVLHWTGALSLPVLIVLVGMVGMFYAPYVACQKALIPELVGEDERTVAQANALLVAGERGAVLAGPPLAGALIVWLDAPIVLLLDAVSFLLAFLIVVAFLPRGFGRGIPTRAGDLLAGVRALMGDCLLGPWTISIGGFEAAWQMLVVTLPVLAFVRYDGDATVVGIALGALGLGALIGNVIAIRVLPRTDPARLAALAKIVQVAAFWVLAVSLPRFGLAGVLLAAGVMSGLVNAPVTAIRTMRMPRDLRPATGAAFLTVLVLLSAVGLAIVGPVLDAYGARTTLVIVALLQTAFTVVFVAAGVRDARSAVPVSV